MPPLTLEQTFALAVQHHQAGRLPQAEAIYRQVLAMQPNFTQAYSNLAIVLKRQGKLDEAIALFRHAIAIDPQFAPAHSNLANALKDKGQLDQAIAALQTAIALNPAFADAHNNLGVVLKDKGLLDRAVAAFRQAIAVNPKFTPAYSNLGNALKEIGQLDQAIDTHRQAIALSPNMPEAHNNLGIALRCRRNLDEAITAHRHAITLQPNYTEAHYNLGAALRENGQLDEAIAACQQAVALNPRLPHAHIHLGNALKDKNHVEQTIAEYEKAIALDPNLADAYSNLAGVLKDIGRLDDALIAYRKASSIAPHHPSIDSNLLFALHFHPAYDAQSMGEESHRWNQRHAQPLQKLSPQNYPQNRNADRPLRIGYVSPDFRDHSVARFAMPLLTTHDHHRFEIFCYAQVPSPDRTTHQFCQSADHWRDIVGLSDDRVVEMIRQDQIDILIDLAGHTADNRLLVFAHKPAPVQVTYLGYPGTTGLDTIDYRLTDALADPPGLTDSHHTEQLIRLPTCAWCYQPPANTPEVNSPPALQNNRITFGCFNNFAKVNEPMLKCWAQILHRVPRSILLLKSKGLMCQSARQWVINIMRKSGIDADRLDLRSWVPAKEHLDHYHQIDIALDTYPYHGTTTTCESLWMGVPVITLAGQSHVSRVGVSLLTNVGLPHLIANSSDQYVQIAANLATDLPRLTELRASLRQRMNESPLMDTPKFTKNIEAAYRQMWQTWSEYSQRSHGEEHRQIKSK